MSAHNQANAKLRGRTYRFARAPFALLALLIVFASLVPCESASLGTDLDQWASYQSQLPELPTDSGDTPSCPDNCACLCAGSCCAALVSAAAPLASAESHNLRFFSNTLLHSQLFSERLFRPPRLSVLA